VFHKCLKAELLEGVSETEIDIYSVVERPTDDKITFSLELAVNWTLLWNGSLVFGKLIIDRVDNGQRIV